MATRNYFYSRNNYKSCSITREIEPEKVFESQEEARLFVNLCRDFQLDKRSPADQSLLVRAFFHALQCGRLDKQINSQEILKGSKTLLKERREESKLVSLLLHETGLTGSQIQEHETTENASEILRSIFGKKKEDGNKSTE